MELIPEFRYWARLKAPVDFGVTPIGQRIFAEAVEGVLEGDRLSGTFSTGGGDWLLIGPDGYGRLDVRAQFETHDGAKIYLQYFGVMEMTPGMQEALGGQTETQYDDQYFRTAPRLETGDERYAWVNQTLFVARGRLRHGPTVEYEVFRVA